MEKQKDEVGKKGQPKTSAGAHLWGTAHSSAEGPEAEKDAEPGLMYREACDWAQSIRGDLSGAQRKDRSNV